MTTPQYKTTEDLIGGGAYNRMAYLSVSDKAKELRGLDLYVEGWARRLLVLEAKPIGDQTYVALAMSSESKFWLVQLKVVADAITVEWGKDTYTSSVFRDSIFDGLADYAGAC